MVIKEREQQLGERRQGEKTRRGDKERRVVGSTEQQLGERRRGEETRRGDKEGG